MTGPVHARNVHAHYAAIDGTSSARFLRARLRAGMALLTRAAGRPGHSGTQASGPAARKRRGAPARTLYDRASVCSFAGAGQTHCGLTRVGARATTRAAGPGGDQRHASTTGRAGTGDDPEARPATAAVTRRAHKARSHPARPAARPGHAARGRAAVHAAAARRPHALPAARRLGLSVTRSVPSIHGFSGAPQQHGQAARARSCTGSPPSSSTRPRRPVAQAWTSWSLLMREW